MPCDEEVPNTIVPPSGAARATTSEPMTPPKRAQFSTTTVTPSRGATCSPNRRARISVPPPAGNGTTMRSVCGRAGVCADAANGQAASARTARR
jgi:hypothetical protein